MGGVLMFRSERMRRTGARSSASGTSSPMQSWADCITGTHESSFWKRQELSALHRRHFPGCMEGVAMTDSEILKTMARYNQCANHDLFAAVRAMPEGEVVKHRRSLFKNILNTLNHPLVADRMWWAHMHKEPHSHKALNEILYDDFEKLAAAREE